MSWKHGTHSGYNIGCRCEKCTKAHREANYKYYHKNIKASRQRYREYYHKHRDKKREYNRNYFANRKRKLYRLSDNIKHNFGCSVCGENDPNVLIFHHINPNEKKTCVSNLIRGNDIDKLLEEMNKCIVLCANCHIKEHKKQLRR